MALAYIGDWKALVDANKFSFRGFVAFLVWRSAYLTKLLSIQNMVLAPMYWFKSAVFGRDISRF